MKVCKKNFLENHDKLLLRHAFFSSSAACRLEVSGIRFEERFLVNLREVNN